jgi:ParB-like chromosome segregation protein Spo0J
MKILDELKSLLPPLTDEESDSLRTSISKHGIIDPVKVWIDPDGEQVIIDGHNRYQIAEELGLPVPTQVLEFDDLKAVKAFMIRAQLGRRNISDYQRSKLVIDLSRLTSTSIRTTAEAANLSRQTVAAVVEIEEKGVPEVKAAAASGDIGIYTAKKIAQMPPEDQKRAVEKKRKAAPPAKPEPTTEPVEEDATNVTIDPAPWKRLCSTLNTIRSDFEALAEQRNGWFSKRRAQSVDEQIEQLKTEIMYGAPYCQCPRCNGKTCKHCDKAGYINQSIYNQLEPEWKDQCHVP